MRVMVLVKATAESERGVFPTAWTMEMLAAMGRFNEELRQAGVLLAAEGLTPSSRGKRVAFNGEERHVIDGPFTANGELVAGYWLWQVQDMDEALRWAQRCPNPMPVPSEIEIRPLFEAAELPQPAGKNASSATSKPALSRL